MKTVAVSAGYIAPAARQDFFEHIDAANIDLKAFTEHFYEQFCFAHLEPILATLVWLKEETDVWVEVTTLLIPGHNDSEAEINRLCHWFMRHLGPKVPLHFTAFHPDFKMMDVPPTPAATLTRAREQALAVGLHYVYTGNVYDTSGQSTVCPSCGHLLIERNWYNLGHWHLDGEGCCRYCGTPVAGHFEAKPGTWGARRQRVVIAA